MADSNTDVESLQQRDQRCGRCLDVFLVTSVVILFVSVVGLAVAGLMTVNRLHTPPQMPEFDAAKLIDGTSSPSFKNQNYVYLEPSTEKLENGTLNWPQVYYGEETSLGSNYELNKKRRSLKPLREGTYFLYFNVEVTCTSICKPGIFKLNVSDKLTCNIELPANKTSVDKKCWSVTTMHGEELVIQMTVPEKGLIHWKLDKGSGFGMFLID